MLYLVRLTIGLVLEWTAVAVHGFVILPVARDGMNGLRKKEVAEEEWRCNSRREGSSREVARLCFAGTQAGRERVALSLRHYKLAQSSRLLSLCRADGRGSVTETIEQHETRITVAPRAPGTTGTTGTGTTGTTGMDTTGTTGTGTKCTEEQLEPQAIFLFFNRGLPHTPVALGPECDGQQGAEPLCRPSPLPPKKAQAVLDMQRDETLVS